MTSIVMGCRGLHFAARHSNEERLGKDKGGQKQFATV